MKEDNIFLALLLPGPAHPGRDIDILLEPLIDELKSLWVDGVETYDVSKKQHFIMKASLIWTVSNFPAYEMLSGWGTHGRLACPYCMAETKSFRLLNGGKPTWFGCHRCFLDKDNVLRKDANNFIYGKADNSKRPPMLTGEEALKELDKFPPIKWGKTGKLDQILGYGKTHHWQKKSIFFRLPYWSKNLLRHNIDLMHLEKNFAENLIYMLFDIPNKTKDNAKARDDLKVYCNRPSLHLTENGLKPKAPYALTYAEKRQVMTWLKETVRFPNGYASNLSRCVNLTNCTLSGLKSHDFHVFIERLIPVAFRDFVPDSIWDLLCSISKFFREICAKELNRARVEELEKEIVETICKLEMHFPPSFFDSMEHLVIHVAHEARIGGPTGPRWMYACERYIFFFMT